MIISCPKCNSRYELDDALISVNHASKAKCYRCESIFSVRRRSPEHLEKIVHSLKKDIDDWESKNSFYEDVEPKESLGESDISNGFSEDIESVKSEKELNVFQSETDILNELYEEGDENKPLTSDEEAEINSLLNEIESRDINEIPEKGESLEELAAIFPDKSDSEVNGHTKSDSSELDSLLSEFHEISDKAESDSKAEIDELISDDANKPSDEDEIEKLLSEVKGEANEISKSLSYQDDIDKLISEEEAEKSSSIQIEAVDDSQQADTLGGQDDIDKLMAEAKGEKTEPTESLSGQDDIDTILAAARGEAKPPADKTEEATDLSGKSDTLGGQDDIDIIMAEARGEKFDSSQSLDGQDDIDKILEAARGEIKPPADKTEKATDLSGGSDTLGGQDDIDIIMAEARGEKFDSSQSLGGQDDIDKILADASSEKMSANVDPDTQNKGSEILSASDLENLLSGEGGEDSGFMKDGDKTSEIQDNADKTIADSADQPPRASSSSKSQILSEDDLEKLLSGAAGEDSGFMKDESAPADKALDESDDRTNIEVTDEEEPKTEVSDSDLETLISTGESRKEETRDNEEDEVSKEKESEDEDVKVKKKRFNFIFSFIQRFKRKGAKEEDELEELIDEKTEELSDETSKPKGKVLKKVFVSVGIILLIAGGGLSAYFFTINKTGKDTLKDIAEINNDKKKSVVAKEHAAVIPEESQPAEESPTSDTHEKQETKIDLPVKEENQEQNKPSLQPMGRESSQVNIGIILPVYRNLDELKILDIVLKIDFMSPDVASKVRNNLPYYETKLEESIDSYFSDKLYDDIPFVKDQLQKSLLVDINNFVTFGKARSVAVEFLKLKENEEKSAENEKNH